jgi:hypothetical protein
MLSKRSQCPSSQRRDSAVTFPKVDASEMEEYGVETYGSIEGRKAMNKTLASRLFYL